MKKAFGIILGVVLLLGTLFTAGVIFGNEEGLKVNPEKIEAVVDTTGTLVVSDKETAYKSSDSQIVTIDDVGQWKIIGVGTAVITVTEEGKEPVEISVVGFETPLTQTLVPFAAPNDVIPDEALRMAINQNLGMTPLTSPISVAQVESLSYIAASGSTDVTSTNPRVNSLEGLQYGTDLQQVSVYYGNLGAADSLAPISNLKDMEHLNFIYSNLTSANLPYLANLSKLNYLDLNYNKLENFQGLDPLFESLLARQQINPNISFFMPTLANPINDFSEAQKLYEFNYNQGIYNGFTPDEAISNALQSVMVYAGNNIYEFINKLDPDWETTRTWGRDIIPQTVPDIWAVRPTSAASEEKNRVPVKEGAIDVFGKRTLFYGVYDWKDDITSGNMDFPSYIGAFEWLYYMNIATNGYGTSNVGDTPQDYFTLTTRESYDHPGETEYYYEGRDFNIVPYNPHATGSADRQEAISALSGGAPMDITVYYIEFKNFEDPQPKEDGSGFDYPNPFENVGDTTTILFPSSYYLPENNQFVYPSSGTITYSQVIRWINPEAPYFEGAVDATLAVSSSFDPLAGIQAFDPTRDADNVDGSTPRNITGDIRLLSGNVDVNTPGTYTLTYEVTSPYGLTATIQRIITVTGTSKPDNGTTHHIIPKTGGMLVAPFIVAVGGWLLVESLRRKNK